MIMQLSEVHTLVAHSSESNETEENFVRGLLHQNLLLIILIWIKILESLGKKTTWHILAIYSKETE